MRLHINREQPKGFFSGRFRFRVKVDLTDEESALVKRYKTETETLMKKEGSIFAMPLKIGNLIKGETFEYNKIADILTAEDNVKEACRVFKNYLEVMRSFGGEETIEY